MDKEPEWVGAALGQLERLPPPHVELKRSTIIALVDARLAGRSPESLWGTPGVCARSTWHEKWKRNALIAEVYEAVAALALRHQDTKTLRALESAATYLALASPEAVGKLIKLMMSQDEGIVLRSATAILDRAGMETAAKGSASVEHRVSGETAALLERVWGEGEA